MLLKSKGLFIGYSSVGWHVAYTIYRQVHASVTVYKCDSVDPTCPSAISLYSHSYELYGSIRLQSHSVMLQKIIPIVCANIRFLVIFVVILSYCQIGDGHFAKVAWSEISFRSDTGPDFMIWTFVSGSNRGLNFCIRIWSWSKLYYQDLILILNVGSEFDPDSECRFRFWSVFDQTQTDFDLIEGGFWT